ncbi:MAG: glyoxalase superfamily protein [Ginsengibacter sp.]
MVKVKSIFRIFDYDKAVDFYINWLGFKIDWEDKPANAPVYLQVSLGDIELHLSEHHGDCTPGATVYIEGFEGLKEYNTRLLAKDYRYNSPGLEETPWGTKCMEVIDPFGNRLTFNAPK